METYIFRSAFLALGLMLICQASNIEASKYIFDDLGVERNLTIGSDAYINDNLSVSTINAVNSISHRTSYIETGSEPIGTIYWNNTKGTLTVRTSSDSYLDIAQESRYYVKANGAISNGDVVQFSTWQGDHYTAKVAVPSEVIAMPELIMGIATEDISNGSFGNITSFGEVTCNTTGWSVNDLLYWDNSTGQLTNVIPDAPNRNILIAAVIKEETSPSSANGIILVRISFGMKLDELEDVDGTTPTENGQLLSWDNDNQYWNVTNQGLLDNLTVTGNIGVGVNNPTQRLAVDGNIILSGNLSSNGGIITYGNIGIGDTTPSYILDCAKATSSGTTYINIRNSQASAGVGDTDESAGIQAQTSVYSSTDAYILGSIVFGKDDDFRTANKRDSNFQISTSLNGTVAEKVRITSDGNVGIGTETPITKLDVVGSARISDYMSVENVFFVHPDNGAPPEPFEHYLFGSEYNIGMRGNVLIGNELTANEMIDLSYLVGFPVAAYSSNVRTFIVPKDLSEGFTNIVFNDFVDSLILLSDTGASCTNAFVQTSLGDGSNIGDVTCLDVSYTNGDNSGSASNVYCVAIKNDLINSEDGNTGTIDNVYGLYIENPETTGVVDNAWAIYSDGGVNYFSGNTGIGTDTPDAKLSVVGDARINGDMTVNTSGTSGIGIRDEYLSYFGCDIPVLHGYNNCGVDFCATDNIFVIKEDKYTPTLVFSDLTGSNKLYVSYGDNQLGISTDVTENANMAISFGGLLGFFNAANILCPDIGVVGGNTDYYGAINLHKEFKAESDNVGDEYIVPMIMRKEGTIIGRNLSVSGFGTVITDTGETTYDGDFVVKTTDKGGGLDTRITVNHDVMSIMQDLSIDGCLTLSSQTGNPSLQIKRDQIVVDEIGLSPLYVPILDGSLEWNDTAISHGIGIQGNLFVREGAGLGNPVLGLISEDGSEILSLTGDFIDNRIETNDMAIANLTVGNYIVVDDYVKVTNNNGYLWVNNIEAYNSAGLDISGSGGTIAMTIDSSGNVGVGTRTPSIEFDVEVPTWFTDTTKYFATINTNNQWISGDGGAEGVYIADNGNVGICSNSPTSRLYVNGSLYSNGNLYVNGDCTITGHLWVNGTLIE